MTTLSIPGDTPSSPRVPDRSHAPVDTDISARSFWAKPYEEREHTFAWLRANEPVSYHRPYESTLVPPEPDSPGFWALTKHEDCVAVSRNQEDFTSTAGVIMEDFPEVVIVASHSFLAMDDPDHNRLRSIVSRAFTAKRTRTMEGWIQSVAKDLVDEMIDKGEGEFCELFAKQMPGRIFAHFFGVEPGSEDAETIMDAAEKMLAWDDPRCAQGRDALFTFAEEAERIQDVASPSPSSASRSRPRTWSRGSCTPRSTVSVWRSGRSPPSSPSWVRRPTTPPAIRWPTPSGCSPSTPTSWRC
jgi:cytochrome P450